MFALWRIFWRSAAWEWRAIVHNPLERAMLIWLPAIAVGMIWATFSASQVHDLPIGVLNKDHSALSRSLLNMIDASPNVAIAEHYRDKQEMETAMRTVGVYAVLIIPKNFSRHIHQVKTSPVKLIVNAQYGTHSSIVQAGVGAAVRTFSAGVELNLRKKMGMSDNQARAAINPIAPTTKMAFNLPINYQQFLAGTLIPALLHILATLVGVGAIGRELRSKSIGKWFATVGGKDNDSTPRFFAMMTALLGKLFWPMLAFSIWVNISLLLLARNTHPNAHSLGITAFNAWLLMILSLWLGVIITTFLMSNRMGLSFAGMLTAPAYSFSGVTYPIVAMPKLAQIISAGLPLTYYLELQIAQIQTHQPWQAALKTTYGFMLTVVIMAILATLLSLVALHRKHRWGGR